MRENKKKSRSKIKISKKGYVIPGADDITFFVIFFGLIDTRLFCSLEFLDLCFIGCCSQQADNDDEQQRYEECG